MMAPLRETSDREHDAVVLGVDAGGSKTAAWLFDTSRAAASAVIGRGYSTSGNPLTVGFDEATHAISEAVAQASGQANRADGRIGRAVLCIAGTADETIRDEFFQWARGRNLADQVAVVPDMLPVLAAGTPACCGVALIAGTGSVAFARGNAGETVRCGGWGYLLGDEGSGYAIGRAAIRIALDHLEGGSGESRLVHDLLQTLDAGSVAAITTRVYDSDNSRAAIAALAPRVIRAAEEGDAAAMAIVEQAGHDLGELVARAARAVALDELAFSVAGGGGVLVGSQLLQDQLRRDLKRRGLNAALQLVPEPLAGCVRLATEGFAGLDLGWR